VPVSDAKVYVDKYFQRYPNVLGYMESTKAQAAADGFVTTVFGRRIFVPGIADSNGNRRAAAQRAAINAPVQGAAADVIKKAMVAVDRWLHNCRSSSACPPAHLVMQVRGDV
jgi:DNA polymerase-1